MAGPGGSEHGRIRIKVVPDTDGFTRKVERLLQKYSKREIEIKVEADTGEAKAELEALEKKYRNLKIKVEADIKRAEEALKRATRDRKARIEAQVASAGNDPRFLSRWGVEFRVGGVPVLRPDRVGRRSGRRGGHDRDGAPGQTKGALVKYGLDGDVVTWISILAIYGVAIAVLTFILTVLATPRCKCQIGRHERGGGRGRDTDQASYRR